MTWNGEAIRRLAATILSVVVSFEWVGTSLAVSEAFHDGLEIKHGLANLTRCFIAVAPMDFSLIAVPLLVGAWCWLRSEREKPSGMFLMLAVGVAALGGLGFLVALQNYRSVMALNGHREATPTMWFANLGVSALLVWLVGREWRRRSAG